jgi:hypothetical protein
MNDYGFLMHAFAAIAVVWGVLSGLSLLANLDDYKVRVGLATITIKWQFFVPYVYLVVYAFWLFS